MNTQELQAFINEFNGIGVDEDGYFGAQCMDLMHLYLYQQGFPLGLFAADTAYQAFAYANDPRFEKIMNDPNDPNQVPLPGDIMFWFPNVKGVTGSAGHVGILYKAQQGVNKFTSFDQNYPTGSVSHLQDHSYAGVAGWLRLKEGGGTGMANMYKGLDLSNPDSMKVAVDVWYDVVHGGVYVKKADADKQLEDVKKQLAECQAKPTGDPALQKKVDDFNKALKAITG